MSTKGRLIKVNERTAWSFNERISKFANILIFQDDVFALQDALFMNLPGITRHSKCHICNESSRRFLATTFNDVCESCISKLILKHSSTTYKYVYKYFLYNELIRTGTTNSNISVFGELISILFLPIIRPAQKVRLMAFPPDKIPHYGCARVGFRD